MAEEFGPLPMTEDEIVRQLALLAFMEETDAMTRTLRQFRWALMELLRLRAKQEAP